MTTTSVSLKHLVRQPATVSGERPPLLILLHGVRSNEEDLFGLAQYLDPRFLVVSLRAPLTLGPGAYGWYNIAFTATGPTHNAAEAAKGREAAVTAIDELVSAYGADPNRVYLMGFSQGAITSLSIALLYPEKIAGAVLMSGRLLPDIPAQTVAPERLEGLPILAVHGLYDDVLGIADGRAIRDYLSHLPVALEYHEYPMGHQVSAESLAAVTTWLTRQLDGKAG